MHRRNYVPQANLLAWCGKTKPNTTKGHINQSKEMYYNTKKLKPGLGASYDSWPGNEEGLFWFQCFINLSLTYLDTYPLTYSPGPTWGDVSYKLHTFLFLRNRSITM